MSSRHPDGLDADYLRWHMLDHLPEQVPRLNGLRLGQRWGFRLPPAGPPGPPPSRRSTRWTMWCSTSSPSRWTPRWTSSSPRQRPGQDRPDADAPSRVQRSARGLGLVLSRRGLLDLGDDTTPQQGRFPATISGPGPIAFKWPAPRTRYPLAGAGSRDGRPPPPRRLLCGLPSAERRGQKSPGGYFQRYRWFLSIYIGGRVQDHLDIRPAGRNKNVESRTCRGLERRHCRSLWSFGRRSAARAINTKGEKLDMRKRNVSHFLTKPRGARKYRNNMTFSMPRDTAARLRQMALARGTDMQGLIELAVNEWLARQLLSTVAQP